MQLNGQEILSLQMIDVSPVFQPLRFQTRNSKSWSRDELFICITVCDGSPKIFVSGSICLAPRCAVGEVADGRFWRVDLR